MKNLLLAAVYCLVAGPVLADDLIKVKSANDVEITMDALEAAVIGAGAEVAARIDHAGAAKDVDLALPPEQVLIFGNPKLGTPAMQADPLAGLYLPLKVLVYEDAAGQVWLAYEDPAKMLSGLNIPADAPFLKTMSGALAKLTGAAAGM